jgi:hypothetical protein
VELTVTQLYENESLYTEMLQLLREADFALASVEPGFTDPSTGALLQFDGVFFRTER